jgi:hypothetical protein
MIYESYVFFYSYTFPILLIKGAIKKKGVVAWIENPLIGASTIHYGTKNQH